MQPPLCHLLNSCRLRTRLAVGEPAKSAFWSLPAPPPDSERGQSRWRLSATTAARPQHRVLSSSSVVSSRPLSPPLCFSTCSTLLVSVSMRKGKGSRSPLPQGCAAVAMTVCADSWRPVSDVRSVRTSGAFVPLAARGGESCPRNKVSLQGRRRGGGPLSHEVPCRKSLARSLSSAAANPGTGWTSQRQTLRWTRSASCFIL